MFESKRNICTARQRMTVDIRKRFLDNSISSERHGFVDDMQVMGCFEGYANIRSQGLAACK